MASAPSSESSSPDSPISSPAAINHGPPAAAGTTAAAATSSPTAVATTGGRPASGRARVWAAVSHPRTRAVSVRASPCQRDQAARYSSRLSIRPARASSTVAVHQAAPFRRDSGDRGEVLARFSPARRRLVVGVLVLVVAAVATLATMFVMSRSSVGVAEPTAQDQTGPVLLVPGYGGNMESLRPLAD